MRLTDRLTCQDLVELVTDYLEGALGSAERERVERHPDSCFDLWFRRHADRLPVSLGGADTPSIPEHPRVTTVEHRRTHSQTRLAYSLMRAARRCKTIVERPSRDPEPSSRASKEGHQQ
jgi:hypothetical protein